jgi:hypothetical protein
LARLRQRFSNNPFGCVRLSNPRLIDQISPHEQRAARRLHRNKGFDMITQIKGLHHVTSMAASASTNNKFFTDTLGLRRVKKTVNFDAPDVYHLY